MTRRIGVDVGGTFTDLVSIDERDRVSVFKLLTTPVDPSKGVLQGIDHLASGPGVNRDDISRVIHGSTVVANSIIERRGARTALITTAGFRDVLELGREARYDLYDLDLERPDPLVPRPLRFEITERVLADGSVHVKLDPDEARRLARRLRDHRVESVAIVLLHAYANPVHERELAEIIGETAPEIDVTLSSMVAPEWREYERTSTATANAYVRPLVRRYLANLQEGLTRVAPRSQLYVLLSHGGVASRDVAADLAVQLVESGPAGGVVAAAFFGRRLGLADLISFDMGGTTTKVSVIRDGTPFRVPELEVARVARFKRGSGLPLKLPTVELIEIGAGGGSLGAADALGRLKVGPRSAGADPGPACYGNGGTQATVTDADLRLGLLNPDYFLGGQMQLYPQLAEGALAQLGSSLGLDTIQTARGMFDIVDRQMALAVRTHVVERGHDPRRFTLVAFGGAGPVHAYEVARHVGIRRLLFPPAAGVASALGFLVSPFAVELSRTFPARLGGIAWERVAQRFQEMEDQAVDLLRRAGADLTKVRFERTADMRYVGQGYEVSVRLPDPPWTVGIEASLHDAFGSAYGRRYGSTLASGRTEVLHWRLRASVATAEPSVAFAPTSAGNAEKGTRRAYFPEIAEDVDCTVYDRYRLAPGTRLRGPILIEERESTVVVGPSADAEVHELGDLVVTFP